MARAATSRLKVNPPLGRMPVLQFMAPGELRIDASYQRSIESGDSKTLIRKIAQHWNWDLCQPATFQFLSNPVTRSLTIKDRIMHAGQWDIVGISPDAPDRGLLEVTAVRGA